MCKIYTINEKWGYLLLKKVKTTQNNWTNEWANEPTSSLRAANEQTSTRKAHKVGRAQTKLIRTLRCDATNWMSDWAQVRALPVFTTQLAILRPSMRALKEFLRWRSICGSISNVSVECSLIWRILPMTTYERHQIQWANVHAKTGERVMYVCTRAGGN